MLHVHAQLTVRTFVKMVVSVLHLTSVAVLQVGVEISVNNVSRTS